MARETGSYRQGFFLTVALADAGIDGFISDLDARLTAVSGSDADSINGTITMNALCENAAGTEYTHKISFTLDTGSVADAKANMVTIVTALATFMTAIEANSDYTTVTQVDVTASITVVN